MGKFDTLSVTVNTVERTYVKAYVPHYAKQLAANNTVALKADITDATLGAGTSYLRISHENSGVTGRHLVSIEDWYADESGKMALMDKEHRVLSCKDGDNDAETRLVDLSEGFDGLMAESGVRAAIVNGEL